MVDTTHSPPPLATTSLDASCPISDPPNSLISPRLVRSPPLLSEIQNIAVHVQPPTIPPHRSHDPANNLKRSEPFQFGSRYLEETDDIFEFNAWDRVDPSTDALYITYTAHQYAFQRSHAVSSFDAHRFNSAPEKWWDKFYSNNAANFFKDRKWLRQEFPILHECTRKPVLNDCSVIRKNVILEVGAGAGNSAFPILAGNENPDLVIHACDYSKKAVELIRENKSYDGRHIRAEVWDVASATGALPPGVQEESVDVVLLIFIFSALSPEQWAQAMRNVWRALKPGGEICFRDYGRGDLAQVRFKKGRWLEENFYVRGDGTRVYFFAEDELSRIWSGGLKPARWRKSPGGSEDKKSAEGVEQQVREEPGLEDDNRPPTVHDEILHTPAFEILSIGVDRRLLVNRQKQLKMYRCWMQGRFRKPDPANFLSLDFRRSS